MFTGIIEETGTVLSFGNGKIQLSAKKVLENSKIGDSISVNGVCLTITKMNSNDFYADVMNETLSRSNLGSLKKGGTVNLERAMAANGRFGGHFVSGHIDGTGKITKIQNDGNAIWIYISAPKEILNLIIEKGSVAIDGISLTVAKVSGEDFAVSVIPHTSEETTLTSKKIGDVVNLENDIIGKYVQKLLKKQDSEEEKNKKLLTWLEE